MSESVLPFESAAWITTPEGLEQKPLTPSRTFDVRLFRRTFKIRDPEACTLRLHLSADARYQLFVNGGPVGYGPAPGDIEHQFYDSYDVSHHLREGANCLAVRVVDYSPIPPNPPTLGAPAMTMTWHGGLVVDAVLEDESNRGEDLSSGRLWRCTFDECRSFHNDGNDFGGFIGYFEHYFPARAIAGWAEPGFDDSGWAGAAEIYPAELHAARRDPASPYGLLPRLTEYQIQEPLKPFGEGWSPDGSVTVESLEDFIAGGKPLHLPANGDYRLILDGGGLHTAVPRLEFSGGAGAEIELVYAEALRLPWDTPGARMLGEPTDHSTVAVLFADESVGWTYDRRGEVRGFRDKISCDGGSNTYEPLDFRTFRFVGLNVHTGGKPLELGSCTFSDRAYPLDERASFDSDKPRFHDYWRISVNTLKLSCHDTFEDCPYYERLQYAGDTAVNSLNRLLLTGDPALSRQAVLMFSWSLNHEGMISARYPTRLPHCIPSWSLHWITMLADYYRLTGDRETLDACAHTVEAILGWFRRHRDASGLPARLPYWNVVDWCPDWQRGAPPGWDRGPTCVISSQYLRALLEAAWLRAAAGGEAGILLEEADRTARLIRETFWNAQEGWFCDEPAASGQEPASQYGNAWAIYSGAADEAQLERLASRFPFDKNLSKAAFFGLYFVLQAMKRLGNFDDAPRIWSIWDEMADFGLDTWAEELTYWRSLCHGWSAHIPIDFLTGILGVQCLEPGWRRVRIAPWACGRARASGSVPTPFGLVSVAWRKGSDNQLAVSYSIPDGIEAEAFEDATTCTPLAGEGSIILPASPPAPARLEPVLSALKRDTAEVEPRR